MKPILEVLKKLPSFYSLEESKHYILIHRTFSSKEELFHTSFVNHESAFYIDNKEKENIELTICFQKPGFSLQSIIFKTDEEKSFYDHKMFDQILFQLNYETGFIDFDEENPYERLKEVSHFPFPDEFLGLKKQKMIFFLSRFLPVCIESFKSDVTGTACASYKLGDSLFIIFRNFTGYTVSHCKQNTPLDESENVDTLSEAMESLKKTITSKRLELIFE